MPLPKKTYTTALLAAAGFVCSFLIIAYTPLRRLIPGYPDEQMRGEIAVNAMRIDSLEKSIYRWELYSANLRRVLEGGTPIQIDSLLKMADCGARMEETSADSPADSPADSALRAKMPGFGLQNIRGSGHHGRNIEGRHFFTPVAGTLSGSFEALLHPYVDISAPAGSTVRAVLDGTVIFKDWNEIDGWSVVLQHSDGVISVYKHNDSILKDVTDKVSAGTAVAILGKNSFDGAKGPHLHFELWYDGQPEDPAHLINFHK